MIKSIIYDMDDLMINSDPLHNIAWEKSLAHFNKKFSNISEEIKSNFLGKRVIDICRELIKIENIDTDLETFYHKRNELFLENIKNNLEARPGLIQSLELFKHNGLKIALASSSIQEIIDLVLNKFDIRYFFDVVISGDYVSIGKPHPETYLITSKHLKVNPEECIVLEDSKNGIESAVQAGCKCIAIINTNTLPQDHSKANLILNSLNEITLDHINSL